MLFRDEVNLGEEAQPQQSEKGCQGPSTPAVARVDCILLAAPNSPMLSAMCV